MGLVEYAQDELKRHGLFDKDSDYDGMLGTAVMDLITVFSIQGHSGASAYMVSELFNKLSRYEPLSALTNDPSEWLDYGESNFLQSTRRPDAFSADGGKTYYCLDEPKKRNWYGKKVRVMHTAVDKESVR